MVPPGTHYLHYCATGSTAGTPQPTYSAVVSFFIPLAAQQVHTCTVCTVFIRQHPHAQVAVYRWDAAQELLLPMDEDEVGV